MNSRIVCRKLNFGQCSDQAGRKLNKMLQRTETYILFNFLQVKMTCVHKCDYNYQNFGLISDGLFGITLL